MILTLELSAPLAKPGVVTRQVFGEDGGTIGRDIKSFWVLPDGEVSGRHALISYRNAVFYIEDTNSTNGISINSADNRLVPSRRYPLKTGDRILIRPYVIAVTIAESAQPPSRSLNPLDSDPFFSSDPFAPGDVPLAGGAPFPTPAAADGAQELDPINLIGGPPKAPPRKVVDARALGGGAPWDAHYRPPEAVAPPKPVPPPVPESIPHDYNPLADSVVDLPAPPPPSPPTPPPLPPPRPPPLPVTPPPLEARFDPTPPPTPVPRLPIAPPPNRSIADEPAPPAAGYVRGLDVKALLEGAGLDGSLQSSELERTFGEILKVVVEGVMEVLRARQEIKDEFRMHLTQFRPTENNPLKFSANVEDALHNLLVKRNPAYLGPVQAFAEAFEDLRHHQVAMLEGMRAAFEAMLEEFDPDVLQKEFDRQVKSGGLLSVPAKLRYWDLYRERCRDMVQDKDASFRKLFGEEFAQAYETQLRRLKSVGRAQSRPGPLEASRPPEE